MKRLHHRPRAARRGVTMIEAVASMVVLAGAMAASINAVASARASQVMVGERAKTRVLAESVLTEVLAHPYAEPGSSTLGPDAGESDGDSRAGFDDVDDYRNWESAVLDAEGTPVPGFEAYVLKIGVDWIDPDDPDDVINNDRGVKRVTVRVFRNGRRTARVRGWVAAP